MDKNTAEYEIKTYEVKEWGGGLPYTVMWIGKAKIPTTVNFSHYDEAKAKYDALVKLGIQPSFLLDINQSTTT